MFLPPEGLQLSKKRLVFIIPNTGIFFQSGRHQHFSCQKLIAQATDWALPATDC
jgi:hypothetical protein